MLMLIRFLENSTFRLQDFNTSHVNVNLYLNLSKARLKINFNTSHVNVNLAVAVVTPILPCNFNTSHVNVNPIVHSKVIY